MDIRDMAYPINKFREIAREIIINLSKEVENTY